MPIFGEIEGIVKGHHFNSRREMHEIGFHMPLQAGIDGNGNTGAASIILSGGFVDDEDFGEEIIYTGQGGRNAASGLQEKDQKWNYMGNPGLLKSWDEGLPIRVTRRDAVSGYNYAGLYYIVDAWQKIGINGYIICQVRLLYQGRNSDVRSTDSVERNYDHSPGDRRTIQTTIVRIVRNTNCASDVKRIYSHKCQICNSTIPTKIGSYAEGAHIRPIGRPHNGEDSLSNLLCLCPNHHVMFDKGVISISDDYQLLGHLSGHLTVHSNHQIDRQFLHYHRQCHGYN